jgi:hypothetical protein
LYVHLLGVILCAAASLADVGFLRVPETLQLPYYLSIAQGPAALTVVACPFAMATVARRLENRSTTFRVAIVALDVGLSLVQVWSLLPTVQ